MRPIHDVGPDLAVSIEVDEVSSAFGGVGVLVESLGPMRTRLTGPFELVLDRLRCGRRGRKPRYEVIRRLFEGPLLDGSESPWGKAPHDSYTRMTTRRCPCCDQPLSVTYDAWMEKSRTECGGEGNGWCANAKLVDMLGGRWVQIPSSERSVCGAIEFSGGRIEVFSEESRKGLALYADCGYLLRTFSAEWWLDDIEADVWRAVREHVGAGLCLGPGPMTVR